MNWQEEVARCMKKWGFKRGQYNPCLYYNEELGIRTLIHGDDFVSVGDAKKIRDMKKMLSDRFEIKTTLLGDGVDEAKEGRVLNRVIRVTKDGWEMEADQRHAEMLIQQMDLEKAKGVDTPGEDLKKYEEDEDAVKLDGIHATKFRSLAARANYLAMDRPDIQYSVKELCREMSSPSRGAWKKLKRLIRYLINHPRLVLKFEYQALQSGVDGYSDSDWAGCVKTAKSTSGGAMMIGTHLIKSWSRTQNSITLSSAEAELVAVSKLAAELLGLAAMLRDWDREVTVDLFVDSSAALGTVARKGAGKLRHINIGLLWLQEKESSGEMRFHKVKGVSNPADLFTKTLSRERISVYLELMQCADRQGSAATALGTQKGHAMQSQGLVV
jgi:hypothetical protein